jgi:BirA family biotin operon repressor/biotin-[acetyl-CoA-carboxylase] ligase
MMQANYINLPEVGSTNTWLRENLASLPHATVVTATNQTAGRGQRGNSWESAPGKNLTFSLLLRPEGFPAANQFYISEAVALGIAGVLQEMLPDRDVAVKWPNDIYVGDKKICGILIENSLMGTDISHSIAGIGINVNQQQFLSDAPNPVSLYQLTECEYPLEPLLHDVVGNILNLLNEDPEKLHQAYLDTLYRPDKARYRDASTGQEFDAAIHAIAPNGMLTLRDLADDALRTYAFKEVSLIFNVQ